MRERVFVTFIRTACERQSIALTIRSDGWLLELEKNGLMHRILGTIFGFNSQVACAIADDKVAASVLLSEAGITNVPHFLLKSRANSQLDEARLRGMLNESDVVIKPLEGSHGHLVTRIKTIEDAHSIVSESGVESWAASPFVEVDHELRLVVVDGAVHLAHTKINPVLVNGLKLFNLSAGATASDVSLHEVPPLLARMATDAVRVLGLRTAAVDIAVTDDGQPSVLEVNAAYSLTYYAGTNKAAYDETALFYDSLVADLFR
ncbi:ATP-grasp domain-containing protein [Candidatus Saccharibacteria bacterium]|nr:ATP-grasp domain-containing protein [Candidatus Saccharibacteria bacterium]